MSKFVLNRNHVITDKGHCIAFRKGEETYVPPELVRQAIGIGAEPVDGNKDAMLPPDQVPEPELTDADRETLLFAAFDEIVARNDSAEFGGDGKPTVDAVKKLVKFSIVKKDIVTMYQKYRASKADA